MQSFLFCEKNPESGIRSSEPEFGTCCESGASSETLRTNDCSRDPFPKRYHQHRPEIQIVSVNAPIRT